MKKAIWVISDTHFDHANIIKYCDRPFSSVEEMNEKMLTNWNKCIKKGDTVYFLGDLAFGKGSRTTDFWIGKLNGNIIFIKGNHDKSKLLKLYEKIELEHGGYKFLLIHSADKAADWKGWIIHGHSHDKEPLYNQLNKKLNVSVEAINYKPISIARIIKIIKKNESGK